MNTNTIIQANYSNIQIIQILQFLSPIVPNPRDRLGTLRNSARISTPILKHIGARQKTNAGWNRSAGHSYNTRHKSSYFHATDDSDLSSLDNEPSNNARKKRSRHPAAPAAPTQSVNLIDMEQRLGDPSITTPVLQRSFEDLRSFEDFCPKIHLRLRLRFIFRCRRIFEASKILSRRLRRFFGKI